jgi:hypothetical protein
MSERHELDLGTGLGVLAEHAVQHGRLRPAAQIRHRGARRRRNVRLAAAAAGLAMIVILGGVALSQQQYINGQGFQPGAPTESPVTPKIDPSAVPGAGIPNREQAVWVQATTTDGYPLLTALPGGAVGATAERDAGDGALFALTPLAPGADEYLLKTGILATGGEPGCATLDGSRVIIDACDASRSEQVVTLGGDGPPFEVVLGGRALIVTGSAVTAVEPGLGTPMTFIIRGQAQDPFD